MILQVHLYYLQTMFFETSGWALPKNIAPQKGQESTSKKNNKTASVPEATTKEGKASREADQIQAQLASLNDQPAISEKEAPKAKKPRVRNKKRALEDKPEEIKPTESNKKAKKNKQQKQQEQPPQEGNKKIQQKKKLQEVSSLEIIRNTQGIYGIYFFLISFCQRKTTPRAM